MLKKGIKEVCRFWVLTFLFIFAIPELGAAETYLGVMGGFNINSEFSDVTSSGAFPDIPLPDSDLGNAGMVGGKAGFYIPDIDWFGFETEAFYTNPSFENFENQGVDANLEVITWAFNALLRYPGERFQPYVGAGVGLFFGEITSDLSGPSLSQKWAPGLNVLAGFRGFVWENIALFAEYKYMQADLDLTTTINELPFGFEGTYSANIIAAGIAYHFR